MLIRLRCTVHNSPVVSAGDDLHWIKRDKWQGPVYELDEADLYCVNGADRPHRFEVSVTFDV